MYEDYFHFRERPFANTPRVDFYFPAASPEQAHHTLARCIERCEGPGLLIGGPGLGKSLVCQMLAERFRDAFHVVVLNSAQLCTRRALLQHLLYGLELPCRGLDEGELRLSLLDFLQRGSSTRQGVLLIVDEAHTLPVRLFEDLRMITNTTRDAQPRVRLVLAGGPSLEERFAHPKMECFNQRLAARCYLQPLNYDEVCAYVRAQVAHAGAAAETIFAADAWLAIHHASGGIPRLVNQVCDHALLLACAAGRRTVGAPLIEDAWADLQQLPTPWQPAASAESVIEFGTLSALDARDAAPSAESQIGGVAESGWDPGVEDAADVADRLDEIQQRLRDLAGDAAPLAATEDAAADQDVATAPDSDGSISARAESIDPFAERFDQEETIVDHYAALQAATGESGQAVNLQRRELTAAMQDIFRTEAHPAPDPCISDPATPPAAQPPQAAAVLPPPATPSAADCDDDDDEVERLYEALSELSFELPGDDRPDNRQPGNEDGTIRLAHEGHEIGRVQVVRTPPPDDNDMIVVLDEQHGQRPLRSSAPVAHRQEYRQLFSRLRQS